MKERVALPSFFALFKSAWKTYSRNFLNLTFIFLSAYLLVLIIKIYQYTYATFSLFGTPDYYNHSSIWAVVAMIIGLTLTAFSIPALIRVLQKRDSFVSAYRYVAQHLVSYLWTTALAVLFYEGVNAIIVPILILIPRIVPIKLWSAAMSFGVYMPHLHFISLIRLILLIPIIVLEIWFWAYPYIFVVEGKRGLVAFIESKRYINPYFWAVTGRVLLAALFLWVITAVIGLLSTPPLTNYLDFILPLFVVPFFVSFGYELYSSLKDVLPEVAQGNNQSGKLYWIALAIIGTLFVMGVTISVIYISINHGFTLR